MILEVETADTKDRKNKAMQYIVKLKGFDVNGVEATLTLKSEWKSDIEKYVPLRSGERRKLDIGLLDHTLSEHEERDMEAHSEMLEKRKQAAKEAGV